ncbi:unnamed protein product [Rotaria magnacalcarata]|nr:unnamed protein product [Rotaria magnacalcarata]
MTKKNQETLSARQQDASAQKKVQPYFENISRQANLNKSYILWIDKKIGDNGFIANQLTSNSQIHIDFCETLAAAQNHVERNLNKIKSSSSIFQVICRGYYKREHKNALDLLFFLNRNQLKHIPAIIFTHDKEGLIKHLDYEASQVGLVEWRERFYITSDTKKLIKKCRCNIAQKHDKPSK